MYQRFGFKILANGNASYTIRHKALTITWLTKQDIHTTYLFFCESSIHNQKMIENRRCPKLPTELADKDIGNSVEVIGFGDRSRTLLKIFETDCDFIENGTVYIYTRKLLRIDLKVESMIPRPPPPLRRARLEKQLYKMQHSWTLLMRIEFNQRDAFTWKKMGTYLICHTQRPTLNWNKYV